MFWAKFSNKEKIGAGIAVAFVMFAVLDRWIISPLRGKITQIDKNIEISEKKLTWNFRNVNQKKEITQEYQKYRKYLDYSGSDETKIAEIFKELQTLAANSQIKLVKTQPRPARKEDFYKEFTAKIEAEGDLDALVEFLQRINNSSQLLRVTKLNIKAKSKGSDTTKKASMLVTKVLIF